MNFLKSFIVVCFGLGLLDNWNGGVMVVGLCVGFGVF